MMTFKQIGQQLGCTDRAAFQVYKSALGKVEAGLKARGIDFRDLIQVEQFQRKVWNVEEAE